MVVVSAAGDVSSEVESTEDGDGMEVLVVVILLLVEVSIVENVGIGNVA